MPNAPVDIFLKWLSERSDQARVAVTVDGDRFLADAGFLGKETITDNRGRPWQMVVFRGDDLAFRLAYRKAQTAEHVLIVLVRSVDAEKKIDVSYITDILAANEGGPPLDLSVPAVFRRICPKINFPVVELRRYKDALLDRIESVPKAVEKIVERWGRPDDWGRGQVAALVLLASHPDWVLADLWPDETDPAAAVAHGLKVLLSVRADSPELPIIRELLQEAVRQNVRESCFWFNLPPDWVAGYLSIRAFIKDIKLQNPAVQLAGLQIFPIEMPLDKLEILSNKVIAAAKADAKTWLLVERRAEDFLTPMRSEKIAVLLNAAAIEKSINAISSPTILFLYLRQAILAFFAKPAASAFPWSTKLSSHPLLKADFGDQAGHRGQCLAAAKLVLGISRMESQLATTVPSFSHADDLLDWYVSSGHYRLELEAAQALHHLIGCQDEEITNTGRSYFSGVDGDVATSAGSLGVRVRQRLDALDAKLAKFAESDPAKLAKDTRSILGFLRSRLEGELVPILSGDSDRRIWVLIFDGMRYDTWEDVVQPLFGEHFTISSEPRFCVLPSYTLYARTSLLAGETASAWAASKSATSRDEAALFAKNIGLAPHEVKEKLRFITDADTTKARAVLGFSDKNSKPVNVLIYPISDECHEYKGDLASFNNKIRRDILGDQETGIRGILDDLLLRLRPGDLVFVTSDHGFVELPPDAAMVVSQSEVALNQATFADAVFYRYAKRFQPAAMYSAVEVKAGNELHYLCVGRQWLKREGVATPVRYSHGGLSLSEVVIPAVRMERVTEKFAAIELTGLPKFIPVDEDKDVAFAFSVRNKGNIDSGYELVVRTNLGEQILVHSADLAPAATSSLKCDVHGTFKLRPTGDIDPAGTITAVELRLRHTDQAGNLREAADGIANIPVTINPKKTKLATDALAGFDEV